MKIVGIDPSLTSTGVAWIDVTGTIRVGRIRSTGRAGSTIEQRWQRLTALTDTIAGGVDRATLLVIEGPAYASVGGSHHDRSGLWWMVVDLALTAGSRVVEIPPAVRCKYACGKGNASKDQVLAAVIRRYPTVDVTGNDEADSLVLAAIGARMLGRPIDDPMPKEHLAALHKIAPFVVPDAPVVPFPLAAGLPW